MSILVDEQEYTALREKVRLLQAKIDEAVRALQYHFDGDCRADDIVADLLKPL